MLYLASPATNVIFKAFSTVNTYLEITAICPTIKVPLTIRKIKVSLTIKKQRYYTLRKRFRLLKASFSLSQSITQYQKIEAVGPVHTLEHVGV